MVQETPQQSASDSGNGVLKNEIIFALIQNLTESFISLTLASGTFGKLKQTLSSSLLTAQDKGKKCEKNKRCVRKTKN